MSQRRAFESCTARFAMCPVQPPEGRGIPCSREALAVFHTVCGSAGYRVCGTEAVIFFTDERLARHIHRSGIPCASSDTRDGRLSQCIDNLSKGVRRLNDQPHIVQV